MHDAARAFVAAVVANRHDELVIEIGGRNINGTIRDLIRTPRYVALDLEAGPGVDVVADCRHWSPPAAATLVLACEVLEHADDPPGIVAAAISYLTPGGRLVLTCAGPGRTPHSGHDGGPLRAGEHYANIEPDDLLQWTLQGLDDVELHRNEAACDLYATGVRRCR